MKTLKCFMLTLALFTLTSMVPAKQNQVEAKRLMWFLYDDTTDYMLVMNTSGNTLIYGELAGDYVDEFMNVAGNINYDPVLNKVVVNGVGAKRNGYWTSISGHYEIYDRWPSL